MLRRKRSSILQLISALQHQQLGLCLGRKVGVMVSLGFLARATPPTKKTTRHQNLFLKGGTHNHANKSKGGSSILAKLEFCSGCCSERSENQEQKHLLMLQRPCVPALAKRMASPDEDDKTLNQLAFLRALGRFSCFRFQTQPSDFGTQIFVFGEFAVAAPEWFFRNKRTPKVSNLFFWGG